MEAKPRRCRDAFDRAPSGLVDPRRSDPLNDPLNPRSKRTDRSRYATKTFACGRKRTLCLTCGGPCTRISLDPRRNFSGQSRPLRGLSFASPRADVACWSVDRTTRRRTPSSAGNPSPARESKGSTERSGDRPRSERRRSAADQAVERLLGPTVEKSIRAVLASRTGLSSDTPWLEILDALEHLEGPHGLDPGLLTTLRWLAEPHAKSGPRLTVLRPASKPEHHSTK